MESIAMTATAVAMSDNEQPRESEIAPRRTPKSFLLPSIIAAFFANFWGFGAIAFVFAVHSSNAIDIADVSV